MDSARNSATNDAGFAGNTRNRIARTPPGHGRDKLARKLADRLEQPLRNGDAGQFRPRVLKIRGRASGYDRCGTAGAKKKIATPCVGIAIIQCCLESGNGFRHFHRIDQGAGLTDRQLIR